MTKKFWCHYIGSDGNTPKRRSIELTNLADLIPAIGDNGHCPTSLWYETEYDDRNKRNYYYLYAQLSDKVALAIPRSGMDEYDVEEINKTDKQIEDEQNERLSKLFADYPKMSEKLKAEDTENTKRWIAELKETRDKRLNFLKSLQNYTDLLLGGEWVTVSALRAYEEVESPFLSTLQALRDYGMEQRKKEEQRRKEEQRKRDEEEAKRKREEEDKEQERLTQEAVKFKNGESIAGEDVVDLCRRYGISIHLRTVHNLQQVVTEINGKEGRCSYHQYGKRSPKLDGCFDTATKLYDYLQTHDAA